MASDRQRDRAARALVALGVLLACAGPAAADSVPARTSYTCVVAGKKVVSDRLIPECANIEQRELNADGSLRRIVKPTPTNDEREEIERREREEKARVSAMNDAIRRDRNLMQRFPDEAAHRKAREKALDDVRLSAKNSGARIELLLEEKKKLDEERKFYENERVRKSLPSGLKQKIDANDAGLEAQRSLAQNAHNELERINALYDAELLRLKKLWAGAPAGSLGPPPDTRSPAATSVAPAVAKTAPSS